VTADARTGTALERARAAVAAAMPRARADLDDLVRIPSVSAAAFDQAHVQAGADAVEALLRGAGLEDVLQVRGTRPDGRPGAPSVVGRRPAPAGAPTVMLYAHQDVQPPGDENAWTTGPFDPQERDGRLYGRGTSDDKGGVVAHLVALRTLLPAWGPDDGVGLVVLVEGEEEIGSPSFPDLLDRHRDLLGADAVVVADATNWALDRPSLNVSLRGLVMADLHVATLDHGVHSGSYGGAAPDAVTATVQLLARLWHPDGSVAVPGLVTAEDPSVDYPPEQISRQAGLLDGVRLAGSGAVAGRVWSRPSITVTGMDVPSVARASNTLLPSTRTRITVRLAPGQDPAAAVEALRTHLLTDPPFGAHVRIDGVETATPFAARTGGPAWTAAAEALSQAWDGAEVVQQGMGGSVPVVAQLAAAYPEAEVLLTAVKDPDARAHGVDESVPLDMLERACVAEVLLLERLSVRRAGS
jgi:acetylornithine deacetylase/succinyl-diaminopimelate desuccinylase-like protein